MNERELERRVMGFVREIGIAPDGKVRSVGFDLTRGVVVISTDDAIYAAPASGLWTDYADNVARLRPRHVSLLRQFPERGTEPGRGSGVRYEGT